jgi:hypothetical protein
MILHHAVWSTTHAYGMRTISQTTVAELLPAACTALLMMIQTAIPMLHAVVCIHSSALLRYVHRPRTYVRPATAWNAQQLFHWLYFVLLLHCTCPCKIDKPVQCGCPTLAPSQLHVPDNTAPPTGCGPTKRPHPQHSVRHTRSAPNDSHARRKTAMSISKQHMHH